MTQLEYIGLIAIVSVFTYAVKKISVSCYRQKAMKAWEQEQRQIARIKIKNRAEMRVE